MSKVNIKVSCFCEFDTVVHFKKPSVFQPETQVFTCSGCGSKMQAMFKKIPGKPQVAVQKRVIAPSDDLKILMEGVVNDEIAKQDSESERIWGK